MKIEKRMVAGLFSITLMFSAAPMVLAEEVPAPESPIASIPKMPEKVELQIHKLKGMESETRSNGLEMKDVLGDAIDGVAFTVSKVKDIDITTDEGWKKVTRLTPENVTTESGELIKTKDGVATGSFGPGLYLVKEEAFPKDNEGNALVNSAPFLITLPMTNPTDRSSWLETVHVYPKNQAVDKPVKEIASEGPVNVGDTITYTIDSVIPELPKDKLFTGFNVLDRLPAELTNGKVTKVQLDEKDFASSLYEVKYQNNALMVSVTDLNKLEAGKTFRVTIEATVNETPQATLNNQAYVLPNDPGTDFNIETGEVPSNPSNTVKSLYGKVNIEKQGEDEKAKLKDATFELRRCDGDTPKTDPIVVNGQDKFTTGVEGKVTIDGIHLGNIQQTEGKDTYTDVWAGRGKNFCLIETKAPEGYELLAQPVKVELTADINTVEVQVIGATIKNVKHNGGFNLPLTGGIGTWITLAAGLLGLVLAALYFYAPRRNKN